MALEEAKWQLNDYAVQHGFALVVDRSTPYIVTLICSQGGTKRSHKPDAWTPQESIRALKTKKTGCQCNIKLANIGDNLRSVTTSYESHSGHHYLSEMDISALPVARRFLMQKYNVASLIVQRCSSGARPRAIWAELRNWHAWVVYKDVDNVIAKHRNQSLNGLTLIEALHDKLKNEPVMSDSLRDNSNRVVSLFFSPHSSRQLISRYPEELLMDCAYSTNKHKMPLLHVVGVTGTCNHFTAGCCFMSDEQEPSYIWALQKLNRVLPRTLTVLVVDDETAFIAALEKTWTSTRVHLCRWHIEKNITTNCKKPGLPTEAYNALMKGWRTASNFSATKDSLSSQWITLQKEIIQPSNESLYKWLQDPVDECTSRLLCEAFDYIDRNKVPQMDRFSSFAVNGYRHFGHIVTSIAEGAHWSTIKIQLKRSGGSMLDVYTRISRSTKMRQDTITDRLKLERVEVLTLPSLFAPVLRGITPYALKIVHKQYVKALHLHQLPSCTRSQRTVMSLPCAHELAIHIEAKSQLSMVEFDRHWY